MKRGGDMDVKLTKDDLDTLYMCRNKAREVARLERKVNSFLPTSAGYYSSPQMTGMPGSRDPHGLDGSKGKNEAEFQALEAAREELEELTYAANKIICSLDWKMHDFCVSYFVRGEDIEAIPDIIRVDRSTCYRKLQKLHGGNSNFRRWREVNAC